MALLFLIFFPVIAAFITFCVQKKWLWIDRVAIISTVASFTSAIAVAVLVISTGSFDVLSIFSIHALEAILLLIVTFVGLISAWYSTMYLRVEMNKGILTPKKIREYFIFFHLFLFCMCLAIATTSPILMWISIEATTLSTAFLISFYNKPAAIEAAWKYLIINSVGLLIAFLGTLLFLYPAIAESSRDILHWSSLLAKAGSYDPFIIKLAFVFVLVGYGTKVGMVPMHTWLPDAHSKAPVPISSLLSGVLLNVALLAVLRFKTITDAAVDADYAGNLLIFFGTLSIILSAFIIFVQKNYKRLLAYSSIEHMGIIALGFGFGGAGIFAAILHMIYHSMLKPVLFLCSGNIFLKYSSTKIKNITGVSTILPHTSILFIAGFLAITGVPPFGMFMTEFSIVYAGFSAHSWISIAVLAALVLIFVGFLRHVSSMFFSKPDESMSKGEMNPKTIIPIAVMFALFTLFSVYIPSPLLTLINSAASVL